MTKRKYIPVFSADYGQEEKSAIHQSIITDPLLTAGKHVDGFEREFAKYHARKYATMTNSGSSALFAAIYAMGWKAGERIIVPAVTFPTAVSPLLWLGLVPVLVDIDETLNIDPQRMWDSIRKTEAAGCVVPHTPVSYTHLTLPTNREV